MDGRRAMSLVAQQTDAPLRQFGADLSVSTRLHPWLTARDPDDGGRVANWHHQVPADSQPAAVPGYLQQAFPGYHGIVWYWCEIDLPGLRPGERVGVRFGAVSYRAEFWLDGDYLGVHEGSGQINLEITHRCGSGQRGLLAVRLLNPTTRRIDGLVLAETPGANAFDEDGYWPGRLYNYGGITGEVDLVRFSDVGLGDLQVIADLATFTVEVGFGIRNDTGSPLEMTWQCGLGAGNGTLVRRSGRLNVPAGGRRMTCKLPVSEPQTWSPDRPFCYDVDVTVLEARSAASAEPGSIHTGRVRTGFRSLTVGADGFFVLNGDRIFLRSTHTGNHVPSGLDGRQRAALLRQDLLNAKAVGLNMVRFIASRGTPEQLDLCDELGLLVYEECNGSWPHGYSPDLEKRFDAEMRETIGRDRNHPCVVAWGLLNETTDGPMFRHAAAALPLVRELDHTRLVLLGSGRWDGDRSIGSVCNPGHDSWQHLWGSEAPDGGRMAVDPGAADELGFVDGMGDLHLYPRVPHSAQDIALLRSMGIGGKPVFLSEYGIGSLFDAVREGLNLELIGAAMDLAEPSVIAAMAERYRADFQRFGLASVFAFPEDLFEDSYRTHSEHRRRGLNAMRANPLLAGHNITGMLDHAVTGEGMWTFARRELKPGVVDAVTDGLAPLRWNIHLDPMHSTVGGALHVDVSLADEAVLSPGRYAGAIRIAGPAGPVWQHEMTVAVPDPVGSRVVHPVLSVDLPADLGAGRYRVTATLHRGAAPHGRTATFIRTDPVGPLSGVGPVWLPVPDDELATWLDERGVTVDGPEGPEGNGSTAGGTAQSVVGGRPPIVLVSAAQPLAGSTWRAVCTAVRAGATAVLLDPAGTVGCQVWRQSPLLHVEIQQDREWLYHSEWIGLRHPLFTDLPGPGLLDWSWYGQTLPRASVLTALEPTDIAAVAIGVGQPRPGGYTSGFVAAGWSVGAGRVVTSTFRLLEQLGKEPAAALLLANLLRSEAGGRSSSD